PLVKNIAQEEGLSQAELDRIPGTGTEGRVTKQDILDYIGKRRDDHPADTVSAATERLSTTLSDEPISTASEEKGSDISKNIAAGDEIVEMDRMRKLIADH